MANVVSDLCRILGGALAQDLQKFDPLRCGDRLTDASRLLVDGVFVLAIGQAHGLSIQVDD